MEPAHTDYGHRRRTLRTQVTARRAATAAITVLVSLLVSDVGFAQGPLTPANELSQLSAQTAAAKKKKKTPTCTKTVTVKKNGKVVKRNGKVVKKKVKTACPKPKPKPKLCVVQTTVKGKLVTVYRYVKVYKTVRRNGKKVKIQVFVPKRDKKGRIIYKTVIRHGKKVRVPRRVPKLKKLAVLGPCKKSGVGTTPPAGQAQLGTPVKLTLQPGSTATLDFYTFTKTTTLTGFVQGFVPGGYLPGQANQLNVTRGQIDVTPVAVVIDDLCGGQVTAAISTSPTTNAILDPSKSSVTAISADGSITGSLNLVLNLSILLRHGDQGCNLPYLTTGYTTTPISLRVFGKLDGLTATLDSPETILENLSACIWPGNALQPCSGFAIPLPIGFSNHIVGAASIG